MNIRLYLAVVTFQDMNLRYMQSHLGAAKYSYATQC